MSADLPPHRYNATLANEIEEKWLARWDETKVYYAPNPTGDLHEPNGDKADRPKYYALDMFPYPSGSGLHVGHPLGYIGTDIYARFKRMTGFNVLHTMGYDAFGLPAERYAVDTGQHPELTTASNIANMRRQLHRLGLGHDPRRSIATTDVEYYRWTQWIFLQIFNSWYDSERETARPIEELVAEFEAGTRPLPDGRSWSDLTQDERDRLVDSFRLAYLDDVQVNWCPALGTVLANEEVTADGRSVIGDHPVYRRPLRQWMMRITAYADRLIRDLEPLEWPESLKAMQRNWVGRSVGARLRFEVDGGEPLEVFTTRPDTLFGATFAVVAPEHPLLDGELPAEWPEGIPDAWRGPGSYAGPADAVAAYRAAASRASERQRQMDTERTGLYTGIDAIHPLTGAPVPILTADYVLMHYGSGAIMGVPSGDQRDFEFARQMELPMKVVVEPPEGWFAGHGLPAGAPIESWPEAYTGHGVSVGADGVLPTDGMPSQEAGRAIIDELATRGAGSPEVSYKLRDWLFSRQRYWGEPFPIVFDPDSGRPVALPESELPVVLPELEDFAPVVSEDEDEAPEPPLARASDWVEAELDLGDGPKRYRRETNTMPQWAGSCWYYLRYLDPRNSERFVDPEVERYWMNPSGDALGGVDLYVGGVEHAVLHLLYARFWHKVLFDLGHVSTAEPFQRLFNQGYVVAAAYQDTRGVYVDAESVEERDGGWFLGDEPLTRTMGKMGKSLKNGVTPDDVIGSYGADALRLYEMFLGPLDQDRPWETEAITGIARFLQRVWRAVVDEETGRARVGDEPAPDELRRATHRTVAAVRDDIEGLRFNTAIAKLMELSHSLVPAGAAGAPREIAEMVVLALAPFAPHMSEEMWERLGHSESLVWEAYPEVDPALLVLDTSSVAVQVNGKLRGVVELPAGASQDDAEAAARSKDRVASALDGKTVRRVIYVPDRLINFVVG
jgi:leucyl-tRNA synthetase